MKRKSTRLNVCLNLSVATLILLVVAEGTTYSRHPEPEIFRIGNAVAPINYWITAWTLNDVFKMTGFGDEKGTVRPSQMWVPIVAGQWQMEGRFDVATDDQGWPTSLKLRNGTRPDKLITVVLDTDTENAFPAGIYRVLYNGTGTLEFQGAEVIDQRSAG
jgi:hypothetical protein